VGKKKEEEAARGRGVRRYWGGMVEQEGVVHKEEFSPPSSRTRGREKRKSPLPSTLCTDSEKKNSD